MTGTAAAGPPRLWRYIKRHPWAISYVIVMTALAGAYFYGGDTAMPEAVFTALQSIGAPVIYPVYFTGLLLDVLSLGSTSSALLVWSLILLTAVSQAVFVSWLWAVAHRPLRPTPQQAAALRRHQPAVRPWPTPWDDDHASIC